MERRVDEIRLMINPQMRFAGRLATQNWCSIVTGYSHLVLHILTEYGVFILIYTWWLKLLLLNNTVFAMSAFYLL